MQTNKILSMVCDTETGFCCPSSKSSVCALGGDCEMIDNDLVCPGKCFNPLQETCCPTTGTLYDVCSCRITCFSNTICGDACLAPPKTTAPTMKPGGSGKTDSTAIGQMTEQQKTPSATTIASHPQTLATASPASKSILQSSLLSLLSILCFVAII